MEYDLAMKINETRTYKSAETHPLAHKIPYRTNTSAPCDCDENTKIWCKADSAMFVKSVKANKKAFAPLGYTPYSTPSILGVRPPGTHDMFKRGLGGFSLTEFDQGDPAKGLRIMVLTSIVTLEASERGGTTAKVSLIPVDRSVLEGEVNATATFLMETKDGQSVVLAEALRVPVGDEGVASEARVREHAGKDVLYVYFSVEYKVGDQFFSELWRERVD